MDSLNQTIIVQSDKLLTEVLSKYSTEETELASAYRLLVAAYKYIDKQKWVAEIVATILETNLDELGRLGGFAHPDNISQEGKVPNLSGWRYFFHGIGCCLTHDDGTQIDVDFPEGRYDVIDPYFFGNYLSSLPNPSELESRFVAPNSIPNAWMAELPNLTALGLIEGDHCFTLTEQGLSIAQKKTPLWDKLENQDNQFAKAHIALLLGELPLAHDFLSEKKESDSFNQVNSLASQFKITSYDSLILSLNGKDEHKKKDIFKAAASIDGTSAIKVVDHILNEGKLSSSTFLALDLIEQIGPEKYSKKLEKLISKAWKGKPPQPGIRVNAVRILMTLYSSDTLPKALRKKLVRALSKRLDRMGDDAAKLLYLLDSTAGLRLLKKCLDSKVPIVKQGGAAALATINSSESINILENHRSVTATTMLAIIKGVEIAQIIPLGSETDLGDRTVRTYSFDDLEAANMETWLRSTYEDTKINYLPLIKKWIN